MKKVLVGIFAIATLMSCETSPSAKIKTEVFKKWEQFYNFQKIIYQSNSQEYIKLELSKDTLFIYENIQKIFVLVFIICILLMIVITPVLLLYHWISSFLDYHKNYKKYLSNGFLLTENQKLTFKQMAIRIQPKKVLKRNMEIKTSNDEQPTTYTLNQKYTKLQELPISNWLSYKITYSNMIGYGFGILAWIISSNVYILTRFDDISVGFKHYFSFPFDVFYNLSSLVESSANDISPEVWMQMIIVVGVSVGSYILGWFLGGYFACKNCQRPELVTLSNIDKS